MMRRATYEMLTLKHCAVLWSRCGNRQRRWPSVAKNEEQRSCKEMEASREDA